MYQPPKGTRDFLPEDMAKRRFIFEKLRSVFEKYGYGEIDTPAFENIELFEKKGSVGGQAVKDIYRFKDKSGRELALRFDMTVPVARVVMSNKLPKPIRFYYISKNWRYEEIKKGRYREFYQAGIELIGPSGSEADAEIIQVTVDLMIALGFENFKIRINSRAILDGFAKKLKIKNTDEVFRVLDKLDKKGEAAVRKEMAGLISKKQTDGLFELISGKTNEMDSILNALDKKYRKYVKVDLSIARGLDYYTGFIFETIMKGFESIGSVCSGGRYDSLIEKFGGEKTPATGFGFGIERIVDIMSEKKMFPDSGKKSFFVVPVNDAMKKKAADICNDLRAVGIAAETDLLGRSLNKNLDYINSKKISYAIIIGQKELDAGKIKLKDMKTGEERDIDMNAIKDVLGFL